MVLSQSEASGITLFIVILLKVTMTLSEQALVDNQYGIVTSKRVTYMAKKGWFSGGVREDVPLKQIVSVRFETSRSIFWGLVCVALGLALLAFVVGIIPLIFGILLLWGSPRVVVVTAGGTSVPVTGWPWQKKEGESFVSTLRTQLFSD